MISFLFDLPVPTVPTMPTVPKDSRCWSSFLRLFTSALVRVSSLRSGSTLEIFEIFEFRIRVSCYDLPTCDAAVLKNLQ